MRNDIGKEKFTISSCGQCRLSQKRFCFVILPTLYNDVLFEDLQNICHMVNNTVQERAWWRQCTAPAATCPRWSWWTRARAPRTPRPGEQLTNHRPPSGHVTPCSPLIGSDGVYTGYCGLASSPGTYSLRITVTDNKGAAVAPRRRGDTHTLLPSVNF